MNIDFQASDGNLDNDLKNHIMEASCDLTMAEYQYKILMDMFQELTNILEDDEEILLQLTNFGNNISMVITDMGYSNPSLIHFYGYVNNIHSTLTQHVSQINVLHQVIKVPPNVKPKRIIGFQTQ